MYIKTCTKCGIAKSAENFYKAKGMKDGYRNDCILCNSNSSKQRYNKEESVARAQKWRKENTERANETQRRHRAANKDRLQLEGFARRFSLTTDQASEWWLRRDKGCELCSSIENLHFDHDHETNIPRGWLCQPHNMGLGLFKDDINSLRAAIEYLEKHSWQLEIV